MRASSMSEPFEARDKLKLRPPRSAGQPLAAHSRRTARNGCATFLFEPFVEVDAFGIFPGGSGQEVQMAGEGFGIDLVEPVRDLVGWRFLPLADILPCQLSGFLDFLDPARLQARPVNFLKIHEVDAVDGCGKLRAGRLEGWGQ